MIRKPTNLTGAAAEFWKQHAGRLIQSGLLTEAKLPAFLNLCRVAGYLDGFDPYAEQHGWLRYFALLKAFQTYGRGFGMSSDKPEAPPPPADTDEFGI